MSLPQGRYEYSTDITSMIFGTSDQTIVLFPQFECEVDVDCQIGSGGDLDITCTDVLIDGVSLRNGDDLAKAIRLFVMLKADDEIEAGGWLFDQVREAEGLSLSGGAGDPETHWRQAAE